MYEQYWKLSKKPFRNTPDPDFYYHSSQHDESLMKLTYAVRENLGAAILTGAYGCGKTLLCRLLLKQSGPSVVGVLSCAQAEMTAIDLLRNVAREAGVEGISAARSEMMSDAILEMIEKSLEENRRDGKHTVVVIDEAHMIVDEAVLETTRLLMNLQRNGEFLLTLLLVGHPELLDRVRSLKQLSQRIPVTCELGHFDADDTSGYVRKRVELAGREGGQEIFQDEALESIYRMSGGIPRRINTLCDLSLTVGAAQEAESISTELVEEASSRFGVL